MGEKTAIQWTWRQLADGTWIEGHSWNPWWGCVRVSPGCQFCYAEGIAHHYKHDVWGPAVNTSRRFFGDKHWQEPITWNRKAEKSGHRRSVFCASMADVFEENPDPQLFVARERLWYLIEETPWLNWLLLTKRPENVMNMCPWPNATMPWPDNVWIGTSVENQKYTDERLPHLLGIPAPVRFVSYEPALEEVDFIPYIDKLNWVICGGESGSNHRPFDLDWARSARDQVLSARLSGFNCRFFYKQFGGVTHAAGGRDLDGRTWDEVPDERPTPVKRTYRISPMEMGEPYNPDEPQIDEVRLARQEEEQFAREHGGS